MREEFRKLEQLRIRIEQRFDHYSEEQLNYRPAPDAWSLLQVIHHLIYAEGRAVSYINKKLKGIDQIRKARLISELRYLVLKIAMILPFKYKAPKFLDTPPAHLNYADLRIEWAAIRAKMKEILDSNPAEHLSKEIFRHHLAGRMNLSQAFRFMQNHIRHHLKQIERIESDPGFPS